MINAKYVVLGVLTILASLWLFIQFAYLVPGDQFGVATLVGLLGGGGFAMITENC